MPENEKETDKAVSNSDINAEYAYTSRLVERGARSCIIDWLKV